jgi:hypothetical protein
MHVHNCTRVSEDGAVRRLVLPFLAAVISLTACTTGEIPRLPRTKAELVSARNIGEDKLAAENRALIIRNVARIKAEYDDYIAGRAVNPPIFDFLILSGGGDWGAFGAGVLKGWGRVPPGSMARPLFDAVTGVRRAP